MVQNVLCQSCKSFDRAYIRKSIFRLLCDFRSLETGTLPIRDFSLLNPAFFTLRPRRTLALGWQFLLPRCSRLLLASVNARTECTLKTAGIQLPAVYEYLSIMFKLRFNFAPLCCNQTAVDTFFQPTLNIKASYAPALMFWYCFSYVFLRLLVYKIKKFFA